MTSKARRCLSLSRRSSSPSGWTTWWSPAKLISASNSTPAARNTRAPCAVARAAVASRSTDLPTPAAPVISRPPPLMAALAMNASSCSSSVSRPNNLTAGSHRGEPPAPPGSSPPRAITPDPTHCGMVSAFTAFRWPRGRGSPLVVSRAVCCSASALTSAPSSTAYAVSQSHSIRTTTAARLP